MTFLKPVFVHYSRRCIICGNHFEVTTLVNIAQVTFSDKTNANIDSVLIRDLESKYVKYTVKHLFVFNIHNLKNGHRKIAVKPVELFMKLLIFHVFIPYGLNGFGIIFNLKKL